MSLVLEMHLDPAREMGVTLLLLEDLITGLHLGPKTMKIIIKNLRKALFMEAKKGT